MSGSTRKCPRFLGDERLPLILQLLEEEISTGPVPVDELSHSERVSNGAAILLGRWPGYITSACVSAAVITVLTTIMIITPTVTITMSDNNVRSELEINTGHELLGTETHCHYQKERDEMMNNGIRASDYDAFHITGLQNLSSFEAVRNNNRIPAQRRVFFVTSESVSTCQLCAVESAAKTASNYDIYIIALSINNTTANTKSYKRFEKLSNLYPNIKFFRFKGYKYFYDSPMTDILRHSNIPLPFVTFAARILTLWRYGGIAYDLDLITLDNTSTETYPFPSGDNIMISTEGAHFMSVRSQCQAFLYDMMMSVNALFAQHHGTSDLSTNNVLERTLKNVCYNASETLKSGTLLREESYKNCEGISVMPHHVICRNAGERTAGNSDCVWALCNGKNVHIRKHLCPVSYRQFTVKDTSQFKRIGTHRIRHKHLY